MEPPPPPTDSRESPKPDPLRPWLGFAVYVVLFAGSQMWGGCERAKQGDERKREAERHDRKLDEVRAKLEELDTRVRQAPPAPR